MAEEFDVVRVQNLPVASSVSDNDMLLVVQSGMLKRVPPSLMKGRPGDPGLSPYLGVTETYIQWRHGANGSWNNLLEIEKLRGPKGEKPIFRKLNGTLQMKYAEQPDTAWINIFDCEELKMKFSDLTPAEIDLLKLHFTDLTEADKAVLMKPATDAAVDARMEITNMRQLEAIVSENEETRENSYTLWLAKEQARQNDELKRKESEAARVKTEQERIIKETERIESERLRTLAETGRKTKESERIVEEQLRMNAEKARKEAEAGRVTAEDEREHNTIQVILDTEEAAKSANAAAKRANNAAAGAENIVKGFQSDWNVSDPADPNYIRNKPEIPTLDTIPGTDTISYLNSTGTTVNFRIGDEVRVLEDGEYIFYRLYDFVDGVASWQESGSGTALPGNIYLQGANYYNDSVITIKEGYINE